MKLLILATLLTYASALTLLELDTKFDQFKAKHGKQYKSPKEELMRKKIFASNLEKIAEHNKKYENNLTTFKLGINQFADLSSEEFKQIYNGLKHSDRINVPKFQRQLKDLPEEVDWRKEGAVTDVKDQGPCGSCWTFSTTGALEGQLFLKTGKLVSLSEQNLVDCSDENDGCDGGDMPQAFQYIKDNDGIDSEESYPYEAETLKCRYKVEGNVTTVSGYVMLEEGDEAALQEALATVGPVAVAFDASSFEFQLYESGIFYKEDCLTGYDELDHAVLAVGYGVENGIEYWLVKNSWGLFWGEEGYIRTARNKNNNCGIATEGVIPNLY